ncbi:hypothetical protein GCM10010517_53800 [Streptosporangium fragile]|uniref:Uncharacterized protein n=1 Tax=Streptosporangium fragile TaxID=46186 RepID=A0ABP6IJG1_9ACTN
MIGNHGEVFGRSLPFGERPALVLVDLMRAYFVRSDLSSLRQTRDLVKRLSAEYPAIDAPVLAAFRFTPVRVETEEGFEHTFAR